MQEVIEVLEENEEVSDFVEVLKKTDIADITTERLTVFAVKNVLGPEVRSVDGVLDTVSIKRHIAQGSYSKSQLTNGTVLTSVSGDNLYITEDGGNVYVNGVEVEGEGIMAGSSYVYTVPKVINEQDSPVPAEYSTTFTAVVIDRDGYTQPLEGVRLTVIDAQTGDTVGVWHTDAEGTVIVKHQTQTIDYTVFKQGYVYTLDDFLIGIDENGELARVDLNGDGVLDAQDKVTLPYTFQKSYANEGESGKAFVYFMAEEDAVTPGADEIAVLWKDVVQKYHGENKALEAQLVSGYGGFNFADVNVLSERYWNLAYSTIEQGQEYLKILQDLEGQDELIARIQVDIALVRTQLAGYYNQLLYDGEVVPIEQLQEDLNRMNDELPAFFRGAVLLLRAKLGLLQSEWMETLHGADQLIISSEYSLSTDLYTPGDEEVIWGNYEDLSGLESGLLHPLLYREAYVLKAIAASKTGNTPMAVESLNVLLAAYGMALVDNVDAGVIMDLLRTCLIGTGQLYPYYRMLEQPIGTQGFSSPKNWSLPIPMAAIDKYPELVQNPGY